MKAFTKKDGCPTEVHLAAEDELALLRWEPDEVGSLDLHKALRQGMAKALPDGRLFVRMSDDL